MTAAPLTPPEPRYRTRAGVTLVWDAGVWRGGTAGDFAAGADLAPLDPAAGAAVPGGWHPLIGCRPGPPDGRVPSPTVGAVLGRCPMRAALL